MSSLSFRFLLHTTLIGILSHLFVHIVFCTFLFHSFSFEKECYLRYHSFSLFLLFGMYVCMLDLVVVFRVCGLFIPSFIDIDYGAVSLGLADGLLIFTSRELTVPSNIKVFFCFILHL